FHERGFFDPRDFLQVRYEMVRRHHVEDVPVAMTARLFGVSLPTAYQAHAAFAAEGIVGLLPKRRGPKQGHKLTPEILAYIEQKTDRAPQLAHQRSVGRSAAYLQAHHSSPQHRASASKQKKI